MAVHLESILIIGSKREGALELAYAGAFKKMGVKDVGHFDVEEPAAALGRNRIVNRLTQQLQAELTGRALLSYLRKNNSRYEAVLNFKGMLITPSWLAKFRSLTPEATWICFHPDDPFDLASRGATNRNIVNSISRYDIYLTWGKHLIPRIEKAGCATALYLPFAHDPARHFPATSIEVNLSETITFVGAWDRQRESLLSQLADFPLKVYGNGWDRVNRRSPLRDKVHPCNLYGEDLRRVISSSKASINILRPQNIGSHNMRTFEIPAMRGLMVATHSEEQNNFFPEGQACLMYKDVNDLRGNLKRVLDGTVDNQMMKESALSFGRQHSYDDRARSLDVAVATYRQRQTGR